MRLVEKLDREAFLHCRTQETDSMTATVRGHQLVLRPDHDFKHIEPDTTAPEQAPHLPRVPRILRERGSDHDG